MGDNKKIQTKDSGRQQETLATIQKWLTRFSALYNHVPGKAISSIWLDCLRSLSVEQLEASFARVEKTFKPTSACPFPAPAHILELVQSATAAHLEKLGEDSWDRVLRVSRMYTPDLPEGGMRGVQFSDRTWYSVRAAGGIAVIATCPLDDLHFRKTDFLNAWKRYSELESDVNFLPDSEAKNLLAELGRQAKQLEQ